VLKNIQITEDNQIIVANPVVLVEEASKRRKNTYMDKFIAGKTKLRRKPGWYPEEKRIEVATLFASGVVNSTELERLTGIPATVVRDWRTSDWWPELLERVHAAHDDATISKFTKIVDKSLETIQDRLNNGDYVVNRKTGEMVRKPVTMKDAASVATVVVDKRQLLRGKPTTRSESVSTDVRLKKLAEEFERFVKAKEIPGEIQGGG